MSVPVLKDSVKETTGSAPGVGSFAPAGAVVGNRTFADVGNGKQTFYKAFDPLASPVAWEVGKGSYSTSGPALSRDTVYSNHLGTTAKINFVNPPFIWLDVPAEQIVVLDQLTSTRFPTYAAAQAATINATVTEVILGGYYAEGDCAPAKYQWVASQPTHAGKFQSADGAWWQYVPDARGANARAFGAKADGAVSGTYTYTGTDNWAAIQACIDYAIYFAKCKPYIPFGIYLISDVLSLGYGVGGFESVWLEGDGPRFRGSPSFLGTTLLCNFSDRPGIAVQGARGTRIKSVGMLGKNFYWIQNNQLMAPVPAVDDTVIANWIDPALNANADSRYAPYCAVAIDPYSGTQPATHYPNVTFPAWAVGTPSQYGKAFSSFVVLEDCYIGGFVTALAIQPCDDDGNGDFIKMDKVQVELVARVISAGNTQGRQFTAINSQFAQFHTGVANGVNGRQQGQLELTSVGSDWENCIQIQDIKDSTNAGSFTFLNSYSESIWRIGVWGNGGADDCSLCYQGHTFNFTAQNDYRGYPVFNLDCSDPVAVTLANCSVYSFKKLFQVRTNSATFEFRNNHTNSGVRTNPYEQIAHQFLGGSIMAGTPISTQTNFPLAFSSHDTFGYDWTSAQTSDPYSRYSITNRNNTCCAWLDKTRPKAQPDYERRTPKLWNAAAKSSFSSMSLSGGTLTATFTARTDQQFYYQGGLPGDVIYDDNSGLVFFIRSRVGTTIIAELQNGYKIVGGTFNGSGMSTGGGTITPTVSFSTSSGALYFGNARIFLPEYYLRGDIQTGSADIINCGRDDGFCSWIDGDSQIVVGDWNFVDALVDNYTSVTNANVTAVNGTTKIITLGGNGSRAVTRQPLGFFIRQPPANM